MFKLPVKTLVLGLVVLLFSILPAIAQKTSKSGKTDNAKAAEINPGAFRPTEIQQDILDEINAARGNPGKYIEFLEGLKKGMNGKIIVMPDGQRLFSQNGADSFDDAIRELRTFPKLELLKLSGGLSRVADLQLTDLKENINLGHRGKDGSDVIMRMYKIGIPGPKMAENISYYSDNARKIVLNMILDEQSITRAHRKNLFSSNFNEIGIAFGRSKDKIAVCVMVFNDKFTEKAEQNGATRVMD